MVTGEVNFMVFDCYLPLRLSLQLFAGSRVERIGGVLTLNHVVDLEPYGWPRKPQG